MDCAVGFKELPVAPAAKHQVGVEYAAQFGAGFGQDARQLHDASQFVAKGG